MKAVFEVLAYVASTQCVGCDKQDKECLIIKTEAFTGPHCARCVIREAKKRSLKPEASLPFAEAP